MHASGFPPISDARATTLILGSLPGQMSLAQRQYYAKPTNAFWPIMGRLFDAGPEWPYDERARRLVAHGIALWDVCGAATRPGSLDAAIVHASVVPNDFATFFASHPQLERICFNGAKAAELYRRCVTPNLPAGLRAIDAVTLPSTSPAHAAMRFEEKLARWSAALQGI